MKPLLRGLVAFGMWLICCGTFAISVSHRLAVHNYLGAAKSAVILGLLLWYAWSAFDKDE